MSKQPRRLTLVDGSGYIFRAFHALPPLTRPDGTPIGAVLGFVNMLLKLLDGHAGDHLAVIFDAGRRSFRNDIYPDYKAHRPDPPPELVPQFALVREATRAFNVPAIELAGFEADDLIATYTRLAREHGMEVIIVSSDKDLMQLVRAGVTMLDPIRQRPIGEAEVRDKFGVGPERVVDVQALAGDASDNVPGVPGIGVKTAAELINAYGDLDTVLARSHEIKQPKRRETLLANRDMARLSRELVRLKDDVAVPERLSAFAPRKPDPETRMAFLRAQDLRSVIARLEAGGAALAPAPARAPPGAPALPPSPAPARYTLVQDLATLDTWIGRASLAGVVAVDTETTSLDPIAAELVGVSLAIVPGEACYIPVGHVAPGAVGEPGGGLDLAGEGSAPPAQLDRRAVLDRLQGLLDDPAVLKVGHNIKFDAQVLARYGLDVAPIDDTMLISYVLAGGAHGHGMDELAGLHLGHKTITYDDVTGTGKARIDFAQVPLARARDYAAEDADVTLCLHLALKPRLVGEHLVGVYETIERPLIPVVRAMEAAGIAVDRDELARLSADFAGRLADLEVRIHKAAGHRFNVGSPAQLGQILFDEMGLQLADGAKPKKTKTGAYATGAEVLDELAGAGHALPALVLDWRQLAKLKSTYADALVGEINPRTGRVHTSFALAATSTGRLASSNPNLQNIPVRTEEGRKIRRAFVAGQGMTLVSLDYSQIELRLLAHVARIEALAEAFRNGIDIHALTASQVFGVPVKGMDPLVRRQAKAINFGIIYGISPFGLARQLGIPQGEARAYIEAYFARYPGIRDYMERTKEEARARGYVTTLFGRRCHIPDINAKPAAQRSFAERAAINAPIQGAAADIIKRAMVRVPAALAGKKLRARMLLQVHDELLFEVPPAEREATAEVVKAVMEGAAAPAVSLAVPLVVEVGHGRSWAEAH
ncbi:MAG: DNA polymerase I [Pseudomonadota bacterium]